MKLFCAYAYTGENIEETKNLISKLRLAFDNQGHELFCNLFDTESISAQATKNTKLVFKIAFSNIQDSDAVIVFIKNSKKSAGQLMEFGVALNLSKPIFIFEHISAKNSNYLSELATKTYYWETEKELLEITKSFCEESKKYLSN